MKIIKVQIIILFLSFNINNCNCNDTGNSAFNDNPSIPLKIKYMYPSAECNDFPINGRVIILFNKNINMSSVSRETFRIFNSETNELVSGIFLYDPNHKNILSFKPDYDEFLLDGNSIKSDQDYKIILESISDTENKILPKQEVSFHSASGIDVNEPNPVIHSKSASELQIKFIKSQTDPEDIVLDPSTINSDKITIKVIGKDVEYKCDTYYDLSKQLLFVYPVSPLPYYIENTPVQFSLEIKQGAVKSLSGISIKTDRSINFQLERKIVNPEPEDGDFYGFNIVMSDDGNIIAVPAYLDDERRGAVYIYSDENFDKPFKLTPDIDDNSIFFGYHAAISDDGTTLAIVNIGLNSTYNVYIYATSDFNNPHIITYSNNIESLSLSKDGSILVVGVKKAVYIYRNRDYNKPDIISNSSFSNSVAISDDGSVIAVGCSLYNDGIGAILLFKNFDYDNPIIINNPGNKKFTSFGLVLALSDDGKQLFVSASKAYNISPDFYGIVYVYSSDDLYSDPQIISVRNLGYNNFEFGRQLSVFGNGNTIAIMGFYDNNPNYCHVFTYRNFQYDMPDLIFKPFDLENHPTFGVSMAFSYDKFIIGAPATNNSNETDCGAIYVYEMTNKHD